jgi:polyhydroxyalkanoate synthesis regulator phasin
MLKEALEDALARGEKMRQEITREILNSQVFSDLANNQRFVSAVARVIKSREEVARSLQRRVQEAISSMKIPSRAQVKAYEKRVAHLEKEIDVISRKLLRKSAVNTVRRSGVKVASAKGTQKKAALKKSMKATALLDKK